MIDHFRCFASFSSYYHISLDRENCAWCFLTVFPQDDEKAGKTKKPFIHAIFMKLRLFFLSFRQLSKSGSDNPRGQHVLPLRGGWKKVRAGKLFDSQREALSVSVAMRCQSRSRCVSDNTFHKASFQVSRRLMKQKHPPLQGFEFCFNRDA